MDGSGLYQGHAPYFYPDEFRGGGNPNASFDSHSGKPVGTSGQPGTRGSMSSLQYQEMANGSHYLRNMEDARNSPRLNAGTPTRFNNSPYTNLPYNSPHQRLSLDSGDSYSHPGMQDPYGHYNMHRDDEYPGTQSSYPAPIDHNSPRYGDEPPYSDHQYPHDSSLDYRASPSGHLPQDDYSHDRSYGDYADHPPPGAPVDHYPSDSHYPDDSFHGPGSENPQLLGRSEIENPGYRQSYQDPVNYDPYGGQPGSMSGDVDGPRYQDEDPYRGSRSHLPEDPYSRNPHDDSYARDPRDDPYNHNSRDDSYARDPHEDPYGRDPRSDPYADHSREDPYADHSREDPYSREHPDDMIRRHEGLPALQSDPFANDPFRDQPRDPREEDPYYRGRSPAVDPDHYGPNGPYEEGEPPYPGKPYDGPDGPDPYHPTAPPYDDYSKQPPYSSREDVQGLGAPPPNDYHSDGRRTPSINGRQPFRWRNPDLQEVIDYLSNPDNEIKAHAAAYLQHLCFMDDDMKAKTRGLGGIPPLVHLLSNEYPEVHRNACGALQNLSYGKNNDDNKRAIRNENGIPELIRLLRKTKDEDVKESVSGILWNLSSCEDLKKPIIDDGLAVLVTVVIVPYSGFDRINSPPYREAEPWTTVFRNATGILRNVSSAGFEARKKLRECRNLVNALIHTLKVAAEGQDIDNKPVENVVCVLRNLSYRIQEVEDPDFYKKRVPPPTSQQDKGESSGCFGGGASKKKGAQGKGEDSKVIQPPKLPAVASEYKGLWGGEIIRLYSVLLKQCSNPVTLEACAGAIQNLTACYWQPAVDNRAMVRKEKGLPNLVDLMTFNNNRVVCAAATALRNLSLDERNRELVGKYAMVPLISKLPDGNRPQEHPTPDDTLCAVLATLYEVVKSNLDFAQTLVNERGLPRLFSINRSEGRYMQRTIKYAHSVLKTMWQYKALHGEYHKLQLREEDFLNCPGKPRADGHGGGGGLASSKSPATSNHTTPYNTLNRPISAQGFDDNTLSTRTLQARNRGGDYGGGGYGGGGPGNDMEGYFSMGHSNSALNADYDRHNYSRNQEEIQMKDIAPGYGTIDDPRPRGGKPPVGGVPLFPNLPAGEAHNTTMGGGPQEPLYAQVNKGNKRGGGGGGSNYKRDDYAHSDTVVLNSGGSGGGGGGPGGADSWV